MHEAVHQICAIALTKGRKPGMIATANAQFAQIARSNQHFRDILREAEIVVADGMSVVMASRLLGHPLPERIAGVDLLMEICKEAAESGLRVYFLGGRPYAAANTAEKMRAMIPALKIAGVDRPPMGFNADEAESMAVVERIRAARPEILFVGFGAPRQEFWMEQHRDELPVKVMIGVGGSFEILSGMKTRAPHWMQHGGLEWLFRLVQEPGRLWRRYLFGNLEFVQMIVWQFMTQRKPV